MLYSFEEAIPFLYTNMDSNPTLKDNLFKDEEVDDNFTSFMEDLTGDNLYGQITLALPEFTTTNDETGETRTFPARTFNFKVTKSDRILGDSYEGKTWLHFENRFSDTDTNESFVFTAYYYWTNYDLLSVSIQKAVPKKPKKEKTTFVVVHKGNAGYNITGIFQKLKNAVGAQTVQDLDSTTKHIEEIPANCTLEFTNEGKAFIGSAVNVFDLNGEYV